MSNSPEVTILKKQNSPIVKKVKGLEDLTVKQLKVLHLVLDYESTKSKNVDEICKGAGITKSYYYSVQQDNSFRKVLFQEREKLLKWKAPDVDKIMFQKIKESDNSGFMSLYYKRIGELQDKQDNQVINVVMGYMPRPPRDEEPDIVDVTPEQIQEQGPNEPVETPEKQENGS